MTTESNKHLGSSFDDFLAGQGAREETVAVASKRVLAWQLADAMIKARLSREDMAARLETTPDQIDRILDPEDDTVALGTIRRAAAAVGRTVRLELT